MVDRKDFGSWLQGPRERTNAAGQYRGRDLGLPPQGPGSVAGFGIRFAGVLIDWTIASFIARGLFGVPLPFSQPPASGAQGFVAIYSVVLGISVAWFVVYLILYLKSRRALRHVGTGIAMRIGRPGVEIRGVYGLADDDRGGVRALPQRRAESDDRARAYHQPLDRRGRGQHRESLEDRVAWLVGAQEQLGTWAIRDVRCDQGGVDHRTSRHTERRVRHARRPRRPLAPREARDADRRHR